MRRPVGRPKAPRQHTYFIATRGAPYFKVGRSIHPHRRLVGIQGGCPLPCVIAGVVKRDIEKRLHGVLRPFRARGEWFSMSEFSMEALMRHGLARIARDIDKVNRDAGGIATKELHETQPFTLECPTCRAGKTMVTPVQEFIEEEEGRAAIKKFSQWQELELARLGASPAGAGRGRG